AVVLRLILNPLVAVVTLSAYGCWLNLWSAGRRIRRCTVRSSGWHRSSRLCVFYRYFERVDLHGELPRICLKSPLRHLFQSGLCRRQQFIDRFRILVPEARGGTNIAACSIASHPQKQARDAIRARAQATLILGYWLCCA